LSFNDETKSAWPFFGIVYDSPEITRLCIALDEDWNPKIVKNICSYKGDNFIIKKYEDGGGVCLFIPQEHFVKFNGKLIEDQEQYLTDFFIKTNKVIVSMATKV